MKNNVKENEEKQKQKQKAKGKQQHQYLESSDSLNCTEPKFWGPWISQIQIKQGLYNNKHIFVIRACRALHCYLIR